MAGHLVVQDVGTLLADHFLARPRLSHHARKISHRPRRNEQRGLAAEHLRGALLQLVHRRIFQKHIVAHFGFGHRAAHFRRRFGDGVGPEINHG